MLRIGLLLLTLVLGALDLDTADAMRILAEVLKRLLHAERLCIQVVRDSLHCSRAHIVLGSYDIVWGEEFILSELFLAGGECLEDIASECGHIGVVRHFLFDAGELAIQFVEALFDTIHAILEVGKVRARWLRWSRA